MPNIIVLPFISFAQTDGPVCCQDTTKRPAWCCYTGGPASERKVRRDLFTRLRA